MQWYTDEHVIYLKYNMYMYNIYLISNKFFIFKLKVNVFFHDSWISLKLSFSSVSVWWCTHVSSCLFSSVSQLFSPLCSSFAYCSSLTQNHQQHRDQIHCSSLTQNHQQHRFEVLSNQVLLHPAIHHGDVFLPGNFQQFRVQRGSSSPSPSTPHRPLVEHLPLWFSEVGHSCLIDSSEPRWSSGWTNRLECWDFQIPQIL